MKGIVVVYSLLIVVGVAGAVGDALLNHWVKTNRILWLTVGFCFWLIACASFAFLLKWERFTFSAAVVLGLLVHSGLAVILDRIYFGGRLTTWQWVGLACAILAIVLMDQGDGEAPALPLVESLVEAAKES